MIRRAALLGLLAVAALGQGVDGEPWVRRWNRFVDRATDFSRSSQLYAETLKEGVRDQRLRRTMDADWVAMQAAWKGLQGDDF